jgi:hypothetical protein
MAGAPCWGHLREQLDPRCAPLPPPRATRSGAFEEALRSQYAEGLAYTETISWAKVKAAARAPSNWILVLQAVPGCLPWGVMQTYMNDYLSQVGFGFGVFGCGALKQLARD